MPSTAGCPRFLCYFTWLLVGTGLALQSACSLPYVIKQGYYQAKLLCGADDIDKVLQGNELTPLQRERLELIVELRRYTQEHLAFLPSSNYTTINLKWDHVIYNITASEPLRFEPYTWWFPIVGNVPYKGFFVKKDAERQRDQLLRKKYDVSMRSVAAYSSLGYFKDPVWPQMLDKPMISLVDLIIHELAHSTLYWPNQTAFNESFANVAGKMGALQFIRERFGVSSEEYKTAQGYYDDLQRYEVFMWRLYLKLEELYGSNLETSEKLQSKKLILEAAPSEFSKIDFKTDWFKKARIEGLNNASLLSFKLYNSDQKTFERLLELLSYDWRRYMSELAKFKNAKDPFADLRSLVKRLEDEGFAPPAVQNKR
jgi:predicted aminopeptidase